MSGLDKKIKTLLEELLMLYGLDYSEEAVNGLMNNILKKESIDLLPNSLKEIKKRKLKQALTKMLRKEKKKSKNLEKPKTKILLEQFLKSYGIYYGKDAAIELMKAILKKESIDFLPDFLKNIKKEELKQVLTKIVKKESKNKETSKEYDLKPLEEYTHTFRGSRKAAACIGISALVLTGIITAFSLIKKTECKETVASSTKNIEINLDNISNTSNYTLNKTNKEGLLKATTLQENRNLGEDKNNQYMEEISSNTAIETKKDFDSSEEKLLKAKKAKKNRKNQGDIEIQVVPDDSTKDILKLYNQKLKGKKLTENDLEILSQEDADLMVIKCEKDTYTQVTKDYVVATTEEGDIKIVSSLTDYEKDYLTNQEIKKDPNFVDFTTVGEFIENNGIKKSGYRLSSNTFWGYESIQKIDDIYGTKVLECIENYGLPIPAYQAKDFYDVNKKNNNVQEKIAKK